MRTHFLLELNRVGGGLDKVFTLEKVVPPAKVNLPAKVTQLAPPPPFFRVISPTRDELTTSCKRAAVFCKEISQK